MTSIENSPQSPVTRAREVLTAAAIKAEELDAITNVELGALALHLGLSVERLSYDKRSKKDEYLAHIGEKICARETYLKDRRFIQKQLANTGLLAAAVGDLTRDPLDRAELLSLEPIDHLAARHPRVDRNVFVDVSIANDLDWLSSLTKPTTAP